MKQGIVPKLSRDHLTLIPSISAMILSAFRTMSDSVLSFFAESFLRRRMSRGPNQKVFRILGVTGPCYFQSRMNKRSISAIQ
jgi:hypothetical protein